MTLFRSITTAVSALFGNLAPRERALGVLLAAVASIMVAVSAADWLDAAENRALAAAEESARNDRIQRELASDTSQAALVAQADDIARLAFAASTIAIARAEAQERLRASAAAAGIEEASVTLDPATASADNLALQRITIEGRFDWRSFALLVDELSNLKEIAYARDLTVTKGRRPTFRLVLVTSLVGART